MITFLYCSFGGSEEHPERNNCGIDTMVCSSEGSKNYLHGTIKETKRFLVHTDGQGLLRFGFVGFYGISTILGYLMQNPVFTYILDI